MKLTTAILGVLASSQTVLAAGREGVVSLSSIIKSALEVNSNSNPGTRNSPSLFEKLKNQITSFTGASEGGVDSRESHHVKPTVKALELEEILPHNGAGDGQSEVEAAQETMQMDPEADILAYESEEAFEQWLSKIEEDTEDYGVHTGQGPEYIKEMLVNANAADDDDSDSESTAGGTYQTSEHKGMRDTWRSEIKEEVGDHDMLAAEGPKHMNEMVIKKYLAYDDELDVSLPDAMHESADWEEVSFTEEAETRHEGEKEPTTRSQEGPQLTDNCPQPRGGGGWQWKVALVFFGTLGVLLPILYSMYTLMGPISLENDSVSIRSIQDLDNTQIKSHFISHPDLFADTMKRGFDANPDAFVEMLVRSGLFKFKRPRQSFIQRSFQGATRSISSMFGRREHHVSRHVYDGDAGDQDTLV